MCGMVESRIPRPESATSRVTCPFARSAERARALAELLGGGPLADGVIVMSPFECDYGTLTTIGARTFVNYGAIVLDAAPVTIGADVQIGPRVQLLTATLIAIFPANLEMALHPERYSRIPGGRPAFLARLPLQLAFIAWVRAAAADTPTTI